MNPFRGIINGSASIAIGIYILIAVYKGGAGYLLEALSQEKGFLVWLLAIFLLMALYETEATRPLAKPLILLTVTAAGIKAANDPTASAGLQQLFSIFKKG